MATSRSVVPFLKAKARGTMDDREIVEAIRSGHPLAPNWFVASHQESVYGLCYRMLRHRQDAEDVVQETFLRAIRAIDRFDASRPVRPWLLGIAVNRCKTVMGQRARRPVIGDQVEETPDPRPGLADPDDVSAEVDRAINRLRPEYRMVFILFHEQQIPYDEIALVMDRPLGTVKTWLFRARTELAEDLVRRGIRC